MHVQETIQAPIDLADSPSISSKEGSSAAEGLSVSPRTLGQDTFHGPVSFMKADTCAREWLKYQGNCYGYFETQMTWHEAEIECQSYGRGAHLASLLTQAETLVVANHIAAYQTDISNVWIGLHDIRHNGRWRWTDESTYNYKAWMPGAPNNSGKDEYCVEAFCERGSRSW
ncbi:regenerating islet-derived protein 4-like [Zootoca vivipara]|uniref:regenerating islet-derived protein 4-like n=1 Tax=Zootoca vivipara TaxID=8524 RepID=UPI00293BA3EE|nr:regenerating islet-derived protein 4-like [Zootoca vivipara]